MDDTLAVVLTFSSGLATGVILPLAIEWWKHRNLEIDEVRRRRVDIVYQLIGSRYVLNPSYHPSSEEVMVFNTAMALVPVYFARKPAIISAYDSFLTSKTDENLYRLLRVAAQAAGVEPLDSTVSRVLTVSAARPISFQLSQKEQTADHSASKAATP